jgi:membrane protease YdiL (CAAX protease family)
MKDVDRNLFKYFGFTFLWSWIIWSLLILAGFGIISISSNILKIVTLPVMIIGMFGPLFGALLTIRGENGKGSSLRYLKGFLDMRIGWKTFVLPTLILGGCTCLAWVIPEFYGEPRLPMLLPSIWLFAPYLIFMILMGGGQEEFGWRGYALPRLEQRMGLWRANIFLGIIWSCWHIPLWFIPGTGQTFMNFGGFILLMTGYSFLLSWVRDMSGNKPFSGIFVHGVANAFIPFMPTILMQKNVPQPRFWIWVILTFIVGVVIMAFRSNKNSKRDKVFL